MKRNFSKVAILALTFFTSLAFAQQDAKSSVEIGRRLVFCQNEGKTITLTAFPEGKAQLFGTSFLVINNNQYVPELIKVGYEITRDATIQVHDENFMLLIQPNGQGLYTRYEVLDTPPELPAEDALSKNTQPAEKKYLYEPMAVKCETPFANAITAGQGYPPAPSGFSTGNSKEKETKYIDNLVKETRLKICIK